jgi:hypothetical protein
VREKALIDMKDSDGKRVKAGDTIYFSYGIPPIRVNAPVVKKKGRLVALTKGHNPEECTLIDLKKYVGDFWKVDNGD